MSCVGDEGTSVARRRRVPRDDFSLVEYADGEAGEAPVWPSRPRCAITCGEPPEVSRAFPAQHQRRATPVPPERRDNLSSTVTVVETTSCAEPGDSGGPMFSEGVALGVTSGGTAISTMRHAFFPAAGHGKRSRCGAPPREARASAPGVRTAGEGAAPLPGGPPGHGARHGCRRLDAPVASHRPPQRRPRMSLVAGARALCHPLVRAGADASYRRHTLTWGEAE
ncbi:trypsin-like serine protease [Streptomyces sp. DHE17-7]|uniref:trypsin-like serine protease n=1 Tax=Streptomyces sp. DHE17-7 TaxID=2759949 RepID=UPI002FCDF4CB